MSAPHIFFFPILANTFITPFERQSRANAVYLRDRLAQIVERRRQAIKKDPSLKEAGDFLTILLTEPLFMNDNKRIIDECLTFFFAGSQTSAVSSQNLMIALMKETHYQEKILDEIDQLIIQPHLDQQIKSGITEA